MRENHALATMAVIFSFFTVIYLLNLFIGLLSSAIDEFDERSSYLSQKAEVNKSMIFCVRVKALTEIEI